MRVILLRPPRYVWPFNSETSAFWQPLGLLCLAAAARKHLPDADVEVWDAPGSHWGWRTLERKIKERRIDVLGVGEETVSAHEAIRAAELVKRWHPECRVVAGGTYFAYSAKNVLPGGVVDVIVHGEGEQTFVELLQCAQDRSRWPGIKGISFLDDSGSPVATQARPLIADLDQLPLPAYDLIDMPRYGRGSRNHPGLVSVEHSRGCIDSCNFCVLWRHMGRSVDGNGTVQPCYRTKSPRRSFEEVRWLYQQFERRTFGWVDPTFNASAEWSDQWAELMLRSELMGARAQPRTIHTAWMRADCVVRDQKLGVLGKLVAAGLRQVMIGVERDDPAGLALLGKHNNSAETCREAFAIFREKYPRVFTIGSIIFGLPGDTMADLRRLMSCEYDMGMDYGFLIPLTPNPGSVASDIARRGGYVDNPDPASYNFHTPVCRTDSLSLRDIESVYWRLMFQPDRRRIGRMLRQVFQPDRRKRRVQAALLAKGTRIAASSLWRRVFHPHHAQPALYSRRPSWYDK